MISNNYSQIQKVNMAAVHLEIQSFIYKFSELASIGCNTSLNFTSTQGKIYANFTAELGHLNSPFYPATNYYGMKLSPTRNRRRQRRQEAKAHSSTQTTQSDITSNDVVESEV